MTSLVDDWRESLSVAVRGYLVLTVLLVAWAVGEGRYGLVPYLVVSAAAWTALGALIGAWLWGRE